MILAVQVESVIEDLEGEDLLIAIVVILFILSLIAERVTNLVKLLPFWNLAIKRSTPKGEKEREWYILLLSLGSGFLVASLTVADFFELIDGKGIKIISEIEWENIPGIILTGFFISLGSKFWHSMLDLVMDFSKLKRFKGPLSSDVNFNSLSEVESFFSEKKQAEGKLEDLVRSHITDLMSMEGFSGYNITWTGSDTPYPQLKFSVKVSSDQKAKFNTWFGSGNYEILYLGEPQLHSQ